MPSSESPKLRRLRQLLRDVESGRLGEADRKTVIADTDGTMVPLTDPRVADVLRRRIAAEAA